MKHIAHILALLLLGAPAQAQQADFIHLTTRDGLSDGNVWPILQDRDGYMWFGTEAGLDRYDGYAVERFIHDPTDEASIPEGRVNALVESPDGTIWVGTGTGLAAMQPRARRFTVIALQPDLPPDSLWTAAVLALHRSGEGTIWAGTTDGLFAFHESRPRAIRRYEHDPDDSASIPHSVVRAITTAGDGTLWIGGGEGIARLDRETGAATRFRPDPEGSARNYIAALQFDRAGNLWIGTFGGGLCRFVLVTQVFTCYQPDPSDPTSIGDDSIHSIFEDDDGRLWLATMLAGISILDPRTGAFTSLQHEPGNASSLAEDDVHRIYRDRFGTLWFSHHFRGVSRTTPGSVRFATERADPDEPPGGRSNILWDVLDDEQGVRWLGTFVGLIQHDLATGSRQLFRPFPELEAHNTPVGNRNLLTGLIRDEQGRLWAGNSTGEVLVFDPRTNRFRLIPTPEHDTWLFPARFVRPQFTDGQGHIWFIARGLGIWRIDPRTETVVEYYAGADEEGRPRGEVIMPFLDEHGVVWAAGTIGRDAHHPVFRRYDHATGAFENIPLNVPADSRYAGIFKSPPQPGVFWIEGGGGLYRADVSSGQVDFFSRSAYGLPRGINAIERDDRGRLWYGTWTGSVGVFDPEQRTSTAFFSQDGISLMRILNASSKPSGDMIFTGWGGSIRFRPDEVLRAGIPPAVHVSTLHAAGESIALAGENELLRLPHDRNSLTFEYVALHFVDPARNQYRYMLEGFDADWNRVGTQRTALYPRLPPGRYTFRVQAAGFDGTWNTEGAAVPFTILPPWWRTWWAYGFYALMLGGGVIGVDRVQRRRLVQKERERTRERELAQAREIERAYRELEQAHDHLKTAQTQLVQQEKLASLGQLTAGIAHEIKNPLNFINNFAHLNEELAREASEDLAAGRSPEEVDALLADIRANAAKIAEHGRRADGIVRSMLEHSRGGSGERQVVDLNRLVEEYVNLAYHGKRAQQPGFDVEILREYAPDAGEVEVVPQDMGRVILNLVGNAFDAVAERAAASGGDGYAPAVRVLTIRNDSTIEICVSDNGPGIPEELRERIFEPFFTTKAAGSGTGLGLSLSYEIVTQGHAGTLEVDGTPGEGTSFTIAIPDSPSFRRP